MTGSNGVNGALNGASASNGAASATPSSSSSSSPATTKVWDRVTQYLPSRNYDSDFWWKYSGLHLAIMLDEANYTPEKQLEALIFFYHWGVSNPKHSTSRRISLTRR